MHGVDQALPSPWLTSRFKKTVYGVLHKLLFHYSINSNIHMALIIIQSIQTLQFSTIENNNFSKFDTLEDYFNYSKTPPSKHKHQLPLIVSKCTCLGVIYQNGQFSYLIFSFLSKHLLFSQKIHDYSGTAFLFPFLTLLILFRIVYIVCCERVLNSADNLLINILNVMFLLFRTILLIPILQIVAISFNSDLREIYRITISPSLVLPVCIINTSGCLIFLCLLIFCIVGVRESDPFSKHSFAGPLNENEILYTSINICLVVYWSVDSRFQNFEAYQIALEVVWFFWLLKRARSQNYFDEKLQKTSRILTTIIFYNHTSILFQNVIAKNLTPSLLLTCVSTFVLICAVQSFVIIQNQRIYLQPIITSKSDIDVECYIYTMIRDIEKLEIPQHRIRLEGFLGLHFETCKTSLQNCSCRMLTCDKERAQLTPQKQKDLWYKFALSLLKQTLNKFQTSSRIYILSSFILKQRQSNKFSALYNLARCLQKQEAGLFYEFIAHHQKECTQQEMKEDDERYNEKKSVNINRYFEFNNIVVLFEKKVEDCVTHHYDFWRELVETSPEVSKLQQLGKTIINQKEQTKEMFERLCELNPNNYQTLFLYGFFLLQVCNEEGTHHKIIQKAEIIKRNMTSSKIVTDELKLKYGENAKTGIVVISGNQNELGEILNVNNQLKGMIGWQRDELIGQNLSMIMPKVFGETHNEVLKRYLATSVERFNFKERGAPAFTKDGYMLPCIAMTKALPNLDLGIQIAGFLSVMREIEEEEFDKLYYYVLYRTDTDVIQGVSKGCCDNFGIEGVLAYGHPKNSSYQLSMKAIFGDVFYDSENLKAMRTKGGLTCRIDTSRLLMEFAIGLESQTQGVDDENSEDQTERFTVKRYRSAEVTVKIKLEMNYNGVPLCLICFSTDSYNQETEKIAYATVQQNLTTPFQTSSLNKKFLGTTGTQGYTVESATTGSNSEDIKELKDFKNFISAKSEPVSIKIIHYSIVCLMLILLILALLTLRASIARKGFIVQGFNELSLSYRKILRIADLTYYMRKLNLLTTWLAPSDLTSTYSNLTVLSNRLKTEQFHLLQSKYSMQRAGGNPFMPITELRLYPDGGNAINDLETSTYNFITNLISLLNNQSATYLGFEPYRAPGSDSYSYKLFSSIIYNGLFSLIDAQKKSGEEIYKFYYCLYDECSFEFPIILATALVVICASIAIVIPYVFSVNKINNRVLSIFGLIPIAEVNFLMSKCIDYLSKYISEAHINRFPSPKPLPDLLNPLSDNDPNSGAASPNPLMKPKSNSMFRKSAISNDRSTILMNGQNSGQTRTVIQYGAALLFLASYFIIDYILIKQMLTTSQRALNNMKIINVRSIGLAQLKSLQTESIIDSALSPTSNSSSVAVLASKLIQNMYGTERDMQNIDVAKFSDDYSWKIGKYNLQDICSLLKSYTAGPAFEKIDYDINNTYFSQTQCRSVHSGILQKGIKTTMISLLEELRIDLSAMANRTKDEKVQKLSVFMEDIERLEKYVIAPMQDLQLTLYRSLMNTLQKETPVQLGKISGAIVLGILFYLLIWSPYLKDLNMKIWRTKGMLNMIPMKIITNNQQLRSEFTSNKLEKAVR